MSQQQHEEEWIGVDLDGTLAHYDGWRGADHIGSPVPAMVERVKAWLAAGRQVKIFTARMHGHTIFTDARTPIEEWCREHIGQVLEITNVKDFHMAELWDDRACQVIYNTGEAVEAREVSPAFPSSIWTHNKSGRLYVVVGECQIELIDEPGVLYRRVNEPEGKLWMRPRSEFLDGRFTAITEGNIDRPRYPAEP